ncbi:MAG: efflux RND transporter periplasmic adaptor subunit, partial [Pseudomonadota bacterium]|nr:efflux RND transporter periplasmic adaptor subunit [Pseudomonadota bacterium]
MKTQNKFMKTPLAIALLATLSFPAWAGDDHGHDHDTAQEKSESHTGESHDDHNAQDAHGDDNASHDHQTEHGEQNEHEETGVTLTSEQQA